MLAVIAAMALAMPAYAQPPVSFEVETSDLDLSTPAGVSRLTKRLVARLHHYCGRIGESRALVAGGYVDGDADVIYSECLSQVRVNDSRPEVQGAMSLAIKRVRG